MATSRIDIFKQMLVSDPINSSILFGLAKEYEKVGQAPEMIETLERYLAIADDEGNAFGMLARAYEKAGQPDQARSTYQRGIDAAMAHGHPSMAEEYKSALEEF
jgi:tetratricopeptide (TPR) repeat protein